MIAGIADGVDDLSTDVLAIVDHAAHIGWTARIMEGKGTLRPRISSSTSLAPSAFLREKIAFQKSRGVRRQLDKLAPAIAGVVDLDGKSCIAEPVDPAQGCASRRE